MRRREFVQLATAAAMVRPLTARAQQQSGMPVVGYLTPKTPEAGAADVAAFREGLQGIGFVEGRDVAIEYRWGNNEYGRLPELAADLVGRKVKVICAVSVANLLKVAGVGKRV